MDLEIAAKSRVGKFLASAPILKAPLIRSDSSTALLRVNRNRLGGPQDDRSAHAVNRTVNRNGRRRREQALIARPMPEDAPLMTTGYFALSLARLMNRVSTQVAV